MRSILIRVGIIAAIVAGGWLLRNYVSSNADTLAVGDCFDPPTGTAEPFQEVQHHPCTEPHVGEVIFVGDYEPASASYPSDEQIADFAYATCIPAFDTYTGLRYDETMDLELSWFWPTSGTWSEGNRKVICYAFDVDESPLTRSIKTAP